MARYVIAGLRSGAQFNPVVSISLIAKRILEGDTDLTALGTLFLNIPVQIGTGLIAGFAAWVWRTRPSTSLHQ